MQTLVISTPAELHNLVSNIERYSSSNTKIHLTGSLYSDLTRTYAAFGKCNVQKTAGKIGVATGIAGGILATIFTAGLALPAALAAATATYGAGSAAMVMAVREFRASPYADEVFILSKHGFDIIFNRPPIIEIG
jgi:hypothetical protein